MNKTTGRGLVGGHLIDHTPFGHWNTQTFIAALHCGRLDVLSVIKGAHLDHVDFADLRFCRSDDCFRGPVRPEKTSESAAIPLKLLD